MGKVKAIFVLLLLVLLALYAVNRMWSSFSPRSVPEGWTHINPPDDVHALAIDGDRVFSGGKGGVCELSVSNRAFVSKITPDDIAFVRSLAVRSDSELWIAHARGLSRYDGSGIETITAEDGLPDSRVNYVMFDSDRRLWVGTWGGAAVRKGTNWEKVTTDDGLVDNMVNVMIQHSEGSMWFGSYIAPRGGLTIIDGDAVQVFSVDNGLPHNNVTAICEMRDGSVWIGTGLYERGGAVQFIKGDNGWEICKTLLKKDGLGGEKVRSLYQSANGSIWLGSEYDGLTVLDSNGLSVVGVEDGLIHPEIKYIVDDHNGDIWLGTRNGITVIPSDKEF